ncbi:hypothetical protein HGRIS_003903 [Hohenbuehelia grisea]|uniref:MYND-type domain-containing protein n=1 Tax=Hohenbuehelia grisea TaxID=104357 RepID=A0ABR3JHS4_9AGAR
MPLASLFACCFVYCTNKPPSAFDKSPAITCTACNFVTYCSVECRLGDVKFHRKDCSPSWLTHPDFAFGSYQAAQFQTAFPIELSRLVLAAYGVLRSPLSQADMTSLQASTSGFCARIVLRQRPESLGLAPFNDLTIGPVDLMPVDNVESILSLLDIRSQYPEGLLHTSFNLIRKLRAGQGLLCLFVVVDAQGPVSVHTDTYPFHELAALDDFGLLYPVDKDVDCSLASRILARRVSLKARLALPNREDALVDEALLCAWREIDTEVD